MVRLSCFLFGVAICCLAVESLNGQGAGIPGECSLSGNVCQQVSCNPPCPGFKNPCTCP